MPKETKKEFNDRMVKDNPGVLRADSSVLFCVLCNCNISGTKLYNVRQHFATSKHKTAVEKNKTAPTQSLLTKSSEPFFPQIYHYLKSTTPI